MMYALVILYLLGCARELKAFRFFCLVMKLTGKMDTMSGITTFIIVVIWPLSAVFNLLFGKNAQLIPNGVDTKDD
jgi:hypothetical protein